MATNPSVKTTVKDFFQTQKSTKTIQEKATGEIEAEVQQERQLQLERKSSKEVIDELNDQINSEIQETHADLIFLSSDHERRGESVEDEIEENFEDVAQQSNETLNLEQEEESHEMSAELTAELLALLKGPRIPPAPLLEGDDSVSWEVFKSKIERGLTAADLFHHIKEEVSEQERARNDYERINMQVITFITNGLPKSVYRSVGHLKIAHEIWQQLVQRFEGVGTNKLAHIMDRYAACQDNYTDAATYAAETSKLADELSAITFNAKDLAVYQTKRYLPSQFSGLKPTLDHMKEPTQKDLCNAIMEYDFKYLKTERSTLASMRKSQTGTSGQSKRRTPCKYCGRTNHWDDQCRQKPKDDDEEEPKFKNRNRTLQA